MDQKIVAINLALTIKRLVQNIFNWDQVKNLCAKDFMGMFLFILIHLFDRESQQVLHV